MPLAQSITHMQDGRRKMDDVKERCNLMQHVRAYILCIAALCWNLLRNKPHGAQSFMRSYKLQRYSRNHPRSTRPEFSLQFL